MHILKGFLPFLAFAVVDRFAGSSIGLVAGAVAAMAMLVQTVLIKRQSLKLLDIGAAVLFGGLALYALTAGPAWSVIGVRLRVDAGLLLIVLASLALHRPFTEQYAREQTPPEYWETSGFKHSNMVISGAWALAFVTIVAVECAMLRLPSVPMHFGVGAIIAALGAAVWFTGWYSKQSLPLAERI